MFIGIACLTAAVVAIVIGRPVIRKSLAGRRLQLAEAAETRKEQARRDQEAVEAYRESQRRYFRDHGMPITPVMSTPRAADVGTLHLGFSVLVRRETEYAVFDVPAECRYGCGERKVRLHEIAVNGGAYWEDIGTYCTGCGAWSYPGQYEMHFKPHGPLGRRLKSATNIFDVLGDPKDGSSEGEWRRLGDEERELEARLNGVRARRLALAERLGKPIGSPFRPQIMTGGKES